MAADRDDGGPRQLSRIDVAVNKCSEGAAARDMLEKTSTALKDAMALTKGNNSSDKIAVLLDTVWIQEIIT